MSLIKLNTAQPLLRHTPGLEVKAYATEVSLNNVQLLQESPVHVSPYGHMCLHVFFALAACAAAANKYKLWLCSTLPVYTELIERWRRITGRVSVLYRLWQRRPGEELLILGHAAVERLPRSDSLQ